ncbi:hypothetical protein ACFYPZ_35750 [Streptomyces sp. NPDC005506]|uniref:hypothetical protein n=1 Tax=unclassified Streptomyces TaxID=2593676 RepID=UPI0036A284EB
MSAPAAQQHRPRARPHPTSPRRNTVPPRPWQPPLSLIVVLLLVTAVLAALAALAPTADECAARIAFTLAPATLAATLMITRHRDRRVERATRRKPLDRG